MKKWNGFDCLEFTFEDRDAIQVFPKERNEKGDWMLKTEYWDAFPAVEIALLEKGFHLAYVKNKTRFATREECDCKARFAAYLSETYGLRKSCVPVGMSCGGAHAVNFAGFYPELISCLYIDAPVLNFCDYPGRLGDEHCASVWENEFVKAYPGIQRYQLVNFEYHPLNRIPTLIEHKVPVVMVYGREDITVNYAVNGKLMEMAYEGTDLLKLFCGSCRGHHPHGIYNMQFDSSELINYIAEQCARKV